MPLIGSSLSLVTCHPCTCASLIEFDFLLFYFDLSFPVFFFSFHLLHCELYFELYNLIAMESLCYSAKGSNDAYDVSVTSQTSDCLGSKQFALEDVSYKCSCCEAGGTQWKRTRNPPTKKSSVRFSSPTDADINFFEQMNTDLCELQQNTWAPLPKLLVVESGAGKQSCQWIS